MLASTLINKLHKALSDWYYADWTERLISDPMFRDGSREFYLAQVKGALFDVATCTIHSAFCLARVYEWSALFFLGTIRGARKKHGR